MSIVKTVRNGIKSVDARKTMILAGLAFLISILLFSITVRGMSLKKTSGTRYKYYTSIEIREGDTLWTLSDDIAKTYGLDTQKCLNELKSINNLTSDTIHAGNYLVIFYYAEEYK